MSKRSGVLLTKRVSDAAGRIKPCANGRGKVARWSFAGGRTDQRVPHASAFIERLWVAAPTRTRRRRFKTSSMLRIVILAVVHSEGP